MFNFFPGTNESVFSAFQTTATYQQTFFEPLKVRTHKMFFLHLDVQPEHPSGGLLTNSWFKILEDTLHLLSSLNDLQPFDAG